MANRVSRRTSPIWKIDTHILQEVVYSSDSLASVLRYFSLVVSGATYRLLKSRLKEDKVDYSHIHLGLDSNRNRCFPSRAVPLDEVMVRNSSYDRSTLRNRLIDAAIVLYRCDICGLAPTWEGKPLSLILDHINGVRNDHRRENLRFLCPNCNIQLPTFGGRNIKRKRKRCRRCYKVISKTADHCSPCYNKTVNKSPVKPAKHILKSLLWQKPTVAIAKDFGVSDKAVEKWAKTYDLTKPPRGYWAKKKSRSV